MFVGNGFEFTIDYCQRSVRVDCGRVRFKVESSSLSVDTSGLCN